MLTPRQAAFVAEYVKDGNATQAAIRAGYSPHGAEVTGCKLLRVPKVAEALQQVQATALQRVAAKTDEAVGSVAWIIEKAGEVVHKALECDSDGTPRNISAATPALALLAKRHPEFRDGPQVNIDARTLIVGESRL